MNASKFRIVIFIIVAVLAANGLTIAQEKTKRSYEAAIKSITKEDSKKHLTYLASDELKGREAGTPSGKKAAEYIAKYFKEWGLKPAGDKNTYMQKVPNLGKPIFGKNNSLTFIIKEKDKKEPTKESFKMDKDYQPLGYVAKVDLTKEIIFAGYGITAPDKKYDDYKGLDVKGKFVLIFRYAPRYKRRDSPFSGLHRPSMHAYLHSKVHNAKKHGAAGIIMVNPPVDKEDHLYGAGRGGSIRKGNIPMIHITRTAADKLLKTSGKNVAQLHKDIDWKLKPITFKIPAVKVQVKVELSRGSGQNVVGLITGNDSKLKEEIVVVGGHYDHLGLGYFGSRWGQKGRDKIHPGADDNASGTVGVMECAKAFAKFAPKVKRTLVFAAWDGEEKGLVGSSYFVENPPIKLKNVIAYINLDMIGRLREKKLYGSGIKSSDKWEGLINLVNKSCGLNIRLGRGIGGSDHMSFARYKIPVVMFNTGGSKEFHSPDDKITVINMDGVVEVSRYVFKLMHYIANSEKNLFKDDKKPPVEEDF